jgi:hypothetical protein
VQASSQKTVPEHTLQEFRDDGAAVVRGLLDDRWLQVIADGVEFNRCNPSPWSHWYTDADEAVGFWSDYVTWRDVDEYRAAAFESPLASAAAQLMDPTEVRFFHEHVLVKEPGATERTRGITTSRTTASTAIKTSASG